MQFESKSIQREILIRVFAIVAPIIVISSLCVTFFFYRDEIGRADDQINRIIDAVEQSTSFAISAGNPDIAQELIGGLLRNDFICSVTIAATGQSVLWQWKKNDISGNCDGKIARNIASQFDKNKHIGTITVFINQQVIGSLARRNALIFAALFASAVLVVAICLWLLISRFVTRPMLEISRQLREIKTTRDARLTLAQGEAGTELGRLRDDINALIDERAKAEELAWQQAHYDSLTGLPNRRVLQDRLQLEVTRAQRSKGGLVVIFMDLDKFKSVNDQLGHDIGDLLLIGAAERMRQGLRKTDLVARLGGDEFSFILPEIEQIEQAEAVAETLRRLLEEPFHLDGHVVQVYASMGMTLCPRDGDKADDLMRNADQAMYVSKRQGGNQFNWFGRSLQTDQAAIAADR